MTVINFWIDLDWVETTIRIFGIFGFELGSISIEIIKRRREAFPYEATRGIFVPRLFRGLPWQ